MPIWLVFEFVCDLIGENHRLPLSQHAKLGQLLLLSYLHRSHCDVLHESGDSRGVEELQLGNELMRRKLDSVVLL